MIRNAETSELIDQPETVLFKVAIKVIDKKRAKEDSYVHKNLRREGRILQLVRHPCIIQLYDILETENSYYLVMELCSGGDMMEYLKIRYISEKLVFFSFFHRVF